jgi:LysM repeat protein
MPSRVTAPAVSALRTLVAGPGSGRRWWLRALVRITGGGLGLLLLIAGVLAYLITLRPDVPAARRLAQSELQVLLEPLERVESAAWARRREWWDGFRETYGILALTDRRVLFVGIPPRELATPERGPQQFVVMQVPRDVTVRVRKGRADLGSVPGVIVENDRGRLTFASNDVTGVDSIMADISRGKRSENASSELGKRTREYETEVSQRAVWHVVAAGDALASVATRYGTSEAQLTEWNRLTSTTIKIGQRLLVKPGR